MADRIARWKRLIVLAACAGVGVHGVQAQDSVLLEERQAVARRGQELFVRGKYQEAAQSLERAVELSIRVFGAEDTRTTATEGLLAHTYHQLGEYTKAEPFFVRGLAGLEKTKGKNSPAVAACLCTMAFNARKKGDDTRAAEYAQRSVTTWKAVPKKARASYDPSNSNYASALLLQGQLFRAKGEFAKAEAVLSLSWKLWQAGTGNDDDDNALETLTLLGYVYVALGDYPKAEPLLQQAAAVAKAKRGGRTRLANVLQELGNLYINTGQMPQAEKALKECLRIRETELGRDHAETATILQVMGGFYRRMGKYEEAEACYRRGLSILEAKHGADSPELFFLVESLAVLQHTRRQYALSLETRQRSLKMVEAKFGPSHPYTGLVLVNIGDDYWQLGEPAKAETFFVRALKLREACLGSDHPETTEALNRLAILCASAGRWEEALADFDRVRRANRRYIARVLPGFSEAQQLSFLQAHPTTTFGYQQALSVGLARSFDAKAVNRSAEWILNGKAIKQQALAERGIFARSTMDPAQVKILEELNAVRSKLAALTLSRPDPGREPAHRKQADRLAAEEQDLAKRLGQAMGRPERDDPWVTLAEVRQALPTDTVLIEIAEFWKTDFEKIKGPVLRDKDAAAHFVAWIVPAAGKGELTIVDLGKSTAIEQAVAAVCKGFQEAPKVIRGKGEQDAYAELLPHLQKLSRLVLEPLLPNLGDKKRIVLSPDTDLWLVPLGALPLPDGRLAVEQFEIGHVISGRDLTVARSKVQSKRPLILADADFDLDRRQAKQTAKELVKNFRNEEITRAPASDLRLGVRRLQYSATEAQQVAPRIEKWLGVKPRVFTDSRALESVVKAAHNPRVLMLSTHGFFLPAQAITPADDRSEQSTRQQNPLLRCGLLLAGCNHPPKAGETGDDGVLTGLEIVGCDLRGTELVVLSACETGVGDIQNRSGEGVAGLRQAFQLAGAEAVVSTLWQVPDRASAQLMIQFFDGLAAQKDKAKALAEAQRAMIKERRQKNGAAHPFFWAAFTLTGK